MKRVLYAFLACGLGAAPACAQGGAMTWVSAPVFIGQTQKPDGSKHVTYLAAIQSEQADSNGYYELFVQEKPYYQESYADAHAIKARALCNEAGDNSCVLGHPGWREVLETFTSP